MNNHSRWKIHISFFHYLFRFKGYAAVGYEYINVDDCWLEKNRGPNNELVADRVRFPKGMKALADYVRDFFLKQ